MGFEVIGKENIYIFQVFFFKNDLFNVGHWKIFLGI